MYTFFSKVRLQIAGTVGALGVSGAPLQPVLPGACSNWSEGDIGKGHLPKERGWGDVSAAVADAELSCSPPPPNPHFPFTDTSHMSFEELLQLQNQVGTKAHKQLVTGSSTKTPSSRPPVRKACVADKHR